MSRQLHRYQSIETALPDSTAHADNYVLNPVHFSALHSFTERGFADSVGTPVLARARCQKPVMPEASNRTNIH